MNIVFVAPRVHPNQTPIIDGLLAHGHKVYYLVQREANYENHAGAAVFTLKPSIISRACLKLAKEIKGDDYAERKSITYFCPKRSYLRSLLRKINPDVIVVRNRTLLSYIAYQECKKYNVKALLYNQTPIYEDINKNYVNPFLKKVVSSCFPKHRMTVVRYKNYPEEQLTYNRDETATFVPFVVRKTNAVKKQYCENSIVHIFDSGKYRDYKNHFFVVDLAKKLKENGYRDFQVTIQGQVENKEERTYYERLKRYIEDGGVSDKVRLLQGVPYDEMEKLFLENDLFILASKNEIANISILDAMMFGLVTISTSTNGTADYIIPGKTGEVYQAGDLDMLCKIVEHYINHKECVAEIGKAAHVYVKENYSFDNYYRAFTDIIKSI